MKRTVYIAGGIGNVPMEKIEDYFNGVQAYLEHFGFDTRSPIRAKVLDNREVKNGEGYCQKYEPNEIVHRDLWDIKSSDIVLAAPSEHSIGTFMEIALARLHYDKPVIVVAKSDRIAKHYWIQAFATKIFDNLDDAVDYMVRWYL